jgi:ABC-type uncharacterized transport system substrate-binding protein
MYGLLCSQSSYAAKILISRSEDKVLNEFETMLKSELTDYEISVLKVSSKTTNNDFAESVKHEKPDYLLLVDNRSVELALQFIKDKKEIAQNLTGVSTMALNLKEILSSGQKNIAGIAYEVPGFSIITQFRYLLDQNIHNVLVFYRKSLFGKTIDEAREQLGREGVNLIALDVEQAGRDQASINAFLEKNLTPVHDNKKVDVVWVLSDNALINGSNFAQIWIPKARSLPIPFVGGIKQFSSAAMDFCVFTSSPNHNDLAHQTTDLLLSIIEKENRPEEVGIEYILSVDKSLNLKRAKALGLKLKEKNLSTVTIEQ